MNPETLQRMREAAEGATPGTRTVEPEVGARVHVRLPDDDERPRITINPPKRYYTDYPTYERDGRIWTKCSTRAAEQAGNYVATPEIKQAIERQNQADAAHIALASPENVLALLDEVEKQRRVIAELTDALGERA